MITYYIVGLIGFVIGAIFALVLTEVLVIRRLGRLDRRKKRRHAIR
jgi:hypothetical protein